MSEDLEVVGVTKKMLRQILNKNTYWKDDIAPLPRSKASWLILNDRISEEDYCGVIAKENKKMVAFIYMFPDLINTHNNEVKKAYWMNDWWVHEKYKDSVLGTYIYNQAIKLTKNQVLIKGYTENVEEFYSKLPFTVIASRFRYTLFFSLDYSMLIGRFKSLNKIKFLVKILDALTGKVVRFINSKRLRNKTYEISYDYINELDDDTWAFIKPLCENDLIYKTKAYISWQISNTQYLQIPLRHKVAYKNLNAGISNNIHIHNLKIIKNHKIIGFLSYVINFNEFNVKYFLVGDKKNYELCVDVLMEHLIKSKRNFIFTDDSELSKNITRRYVTVYTHKVLKKGLVHNDTNFDYNSVNMLNRDGHFY